MFELNLRHVFLECFFVDFLKILTVSRLCKSVILCQLLLRAQITQGAGSFRLVFCLSSVFLVRFCTKESCVFWLGIANSSH